MLHQTKQAKEGGTDGGTKGGKERGEEGTEGAKRIIRSKEQSRAERRTDETGKMEESVASKVCAVAEVGGDGAA